jgi:hypothetical protein
VPLLDLPLFKRGPRFGVEIKRMDVPSLTGSMRIALANLLTGSCCGGLTCSRSHYENAPPLPPAD